MDTQTDGRVGYWIKRLQQTIRTVMDDSLRALGLSTAQYAALNALEQLPEASNADLARACFVTPQTMNEILRGLEADGLVARRPHPTHGRILQAVLTAIGNERLGAAHQVANAIEEHMLAGLTEAERSMLIEQLRQCAANLSYSTSSSFSSRPT